LQTAIVVAVICGLVGASFVMGKERHMDQKIGWGPQTDVWHLSVAISRDFYDLHGYVGFEKVMDTLQTSLDIQSWKASSQEIPAISDGASLNAAFRKAATIEELRGLGSDPMTRTLDEFRDGLIVNGQTVDGSNIVAPVGEDLGESAFYALAFRLFGLRIQSAYLLFYLVFAISLAAFFVEFRNNQTALTILLFNVLAFHIFFYTPFFSQTLIPTVYLNRFESTLCIIAICHFMFLLLERLRMRLSSLSLAVAQLVILLFGLFVRSSADWAVLAAAVLFLLLVARAILRAHEASIVMRLRTAYRVVSVWPMALLIGGVVGLGIYVNTVPHPIYRTLDDSPHHMRWHSAWIGLSIHPDWNKYFPDLPPMSDATAFSLTTNHLKEIGKDSEFNSYYTNQPRIGAHEEYIREQFINFVETHPIYVLEAIFYYKPRAFFQYTWMFFSQIDPSVAISVLAVLLTAAMLARNRRGRVLNNHVVIGVPAVLYVLSLAPIVWAYPAPHVMADELWTTALLASAILWVGLCGAVWLVRGGSRSAAMPTRIGGPSQPGSATLVAQGVIVLGLIGVLMWRAALPSINVVRANYMACTGGASQEPGVEAAPDAINDAITQCFGHERCDFHIISGALCPRALEFSWRCGTDKRVNETRIAGQHAYDAVITCP
jgi:hypothetical protein